MPANIKQDSRGTPLVSLAHNVAAGEVPWLSTEDKFGENPAVGTTFATIWSQGGIYVYPGSSFQMKISSGVAADSGATVRITGQDSAYDIQSEMVTLQGQTAVLTSKSYFRTYRMEMLTHPTVNVNNVGEIFTGTGDLTNGVPAEIFASVDSGLGQTLMAVYTVPRNHQLEMAQHRFFSNSQKPINAALFHRPPGEVFRVDDFVHFFQNHVPVEFPFYKVFGEKTDIELRAKTEQTTAKVSAGFSAVLTNLAL